jgi:GDP-D-mannose 3', 5'-epimerase
MVAAGDSSLPVNIGSSELVTIEHLVDVIEEIAGVKVKRNYKLDAPVGVRGRNSDNTLVQEIYDWEPLIRLADGLEHTYSWVFDQLSEYRAATVAS